MMSCGGWDEERMMTQLFKGKRALITGASSGSGPEVARAFAREGADRVITCRANVVRIKQALREQQPLGARAAGLQADLCQIAEVEALIEEADEEALEQLVLDPSVLDLPDDLAPAAE